MIFENFEIAFVLLGQFLKIFSNALGQFIQYRPSKHVITSTNAQRGKEPINPVSETIGQVFNIKTFFNMSF